MTLRTIILGFLGAAFLSAYCYFNDDVVRQGALVGNLMPVFAYGGLVVFLLVVNPVLRRFRARWAFTGKELAALGAMLLIVCAIPSWGLVQCLPTSIMLPHHFARARPAWKAHGIMQFPPKRMMPDVSKDSDRVLNGYISGLSQGKEHASPLDVPWEAWAKTLAFWMPLLFTIAMATLGLAVVFYRQWVHHEQLPFPISQFAHALLPQGEKTRSSIFRNYLFWIGFCSVFAVQLNNYLCRWWPHVFIYFPLRLDFSALAQLFPTLIKGQGMLILQPRILFAVIGLAFFISTDVSFSMAIGPVIYCLIMGWLTGYGIALRSGDHMSTKIEAFLFTGGYLGILLMILYFGRHYYWNVLTKSLTLGSSAEVGASAAWGMRVFLIGTGAFIGQLILVGLDWQLALIYTGLALMIFIVVSRTIAETGAFHIGTEIFPGAIILGFFGTMAIGPKAVMIMFLVSVVVLVAPGWSPMPFMVQAFKLADMSKVKVSKVAAWAIFGILLSIVISVPATIYWQYDAGAPKRGWPYMVSSFPFENAVKMKVRLEAQGVLEKSTQIEGWERFGNMSPKWSCVAAFFIAIGLSLGIGFCRLRFVRWPLHPVLFVFLGGYQGKLMAGSFFMGWLLKVGVTRYGGARFYNKLVPLMIGVIAGDVTARFVPMAVGTIYYLVTGRQP